MSVLGPHLRTGLLLLLIPLTFVIAAVTQAIQLVLLVVSVAYLGVAAGAFWIQSRRVEDTSIELRDGLLRRGGAWILILFILVIALLITSDYLLGVPTMVIVYAAGIFDQTGLRKEGRAT